MSNRPEGGSAVDLGTSPHGLSAELPLPVQETPEARSLGLSAKPLLTLQVSLTLTEEQRDHLAFAVLCQVDSLAECDEVDELEVQEAIRCLVDVGHMLDQRGSA